MKPSIGKSGISKGAISVSVLWTFLIHLSKGEPDIPPWHLDRLDQQWGIDSAPFHANVIARTRPVLYVIDSGVDREHNAFTSGTSKVRYGYNFADESWDSDDCMGHGTHVAALAAGRKYGVAGSIGVDIVSVRILDCMGRGSCSSMIRGLEWYLTRSNCPLARPNDSRFAASILPDHFVSPPSSFSVWRKNNLSGSQGAPQSFVAAFWSPRSYCDEHWK